MVQCGCGRAHPPNGRMTILSGSRWAAAANSIQVASRSGKRRARAERPSTSSVQVVRCRWSSRRQVRSHGRDIPLTSWSRLPAWVVDAQSSVVSRTCLPKVHRSGPGSRSPFMEGAAAGGAQGSQVHAPQVHRRWGSQAAGGRNLVGVPLTPKSRCDASGRRPRAVRLRGQPRCRGRGECRSQRTGIGGEEVGEGTPRRRGRARVRWENGSRREQAKVHVTGKGQRSCEWRRASTEARRGAARFCREHPARTQARGMWPRVSSTDREGTTAGPEETAVAPRSATAAGAPR